MKKTFFLLLAVLCAGEAFSQSLLWDRVYTKKTGEMTPFFIRPLPDGGWLTMGCDTRFILGGSYFAWYDKYGRLQNDSSMYDAGYFADALVRSDGSVLAVGGVGFNTDGPFYSKTLFKLSNARGEGLGRMEWITRPASSQTRPGYASLTPVAGKLYAIANQDSLVELDTATGESVPRFTLPKLRTRGPSFLYPSAMLSQDGYFYVAHGDTFMKLDSAFRILWQKPRVQGHQLLSLPGNHIAVVDEDRISLLDSSGAVLKTVTSEKFPKKNILRQAVIADGQLIVPAYGPTSAHIAFYDTSLKETRRLDITQFDFIPTCVAVRDTLLAVGGMYLLKEGDETDFSAGVLKVFSLNGQSSPLHQTVALKKAVLRKATVASRSTYVQGYNLWCDVDITIENTTNEYIDTLHLSGYSGTSHYLNYLNGERFTGLRMAPGDTLTVRLHNLAFGDIPSNGNIVNPTFYIIAFGPNDHLNAPESLTASGSFTSIEDGSAAANKVSFSPNPATSHIRLLGDITSPCTLRLYDLTGRLVLEKTGVRGGEELSLDELARGLYQARLEAGGKLVHEAKIIKQ